jgi:hypothetical protein
MTRTEALLHGYLALFVKRKRTGGDIEKKDRQFTLRLPRRAMPVLFFMLFFTATGNEMRSLRLRMADAAVATTES